MSGTKTSFEVVTGLFASANSSARSCRSVSPDHTPAAEDTVTLALFRKPLMRVSTASPKATTESILRAIIFAAVSARAWSSAMFTPRLAAIAISRSSWVVYAYFAP